MSSGDFPVLPPVSDAYHDSVVFQARKRELDARGGNDPLLKWDLDLAAAADAMARIRHWDANRERTPDPHPADWSALAQVGITPKHASRLVDHWDPDVAGWQRTDDGMAR